MKFRRSGAAAVPSAPPGSIPGSPRPPAASPPSQAARDGASPFPFAATPLPAPLFSHLLYALPERSSPHLQRLGSRRGRVAVTHPGGQNGRHRRRRRRRQRMGGARERPSPSPAALARSHLFPTMVRNSATCGRGESSAACFRSRFCLRVLGWCSNKGLMILGFL